MHRVNEEEMTFFGSSRFQQRLQRFLQEFTLGRGVFLDRFLRRQRDRGSATPLQPEMFFKNLRV